MSLFLIAVISLMSVAMLNVMTRGLEADLRAQYFENNTFKANNLAKQIEAYLDTRTKVVSAQAQSATLKQTVMAPEANLGLITDYFSQSTVLGERYTQVLYDFKGDQVYPPLARSDASNTEEPSVGAEAMVSKASLAPLYSGDKALHITLTDDLQFWALSLPVTYRASVEGVLVSYIPVSNMVQALSLQDTANIYLVVETLNGNVLEWGARPASKAASIPTSYPGLEISFAINNQAMEDSFDSAKTRLLIGTLIIAAIATGFAIFLGRWFFVTPLQRLQEFAVALSEGADPHLEQTKRITIEIQELSDKIMEMSQRIRRREQALIESNDTLKQNQTTLVHAEKMAGLGQMTAGVAHEINNPIGFVMNNLTMLNEYHAFLKQLVQQFITLKSQLPPETIEQLSDNIQQIEQTLKQEDLDFVLSDLECITKESIEGAVRVKEITQALKGYAYSGEQVSPTDINDSIESTLKMVWNELKYHCTVEKDLGELPWVDCIGGQINQVLMNLFVNAAHAMEGRSGSVLSIKTEKLDKTVAITISDNGTGIKPEHIQHIFEPFFTTKAVGQGTGLGMSICYDIIKKHGGDIRVESVWGEGTTFVIELPCQS